MGCVTSTEDVKERHNVETEVGDVKFYGPAPSQSAPASALVPLRYDVGKMSSSSRQHSAANDSRMRRPPSSSTIPTGVASGASRGHAPSTGSSSNTPPPMPKTPGLVLTGAEGPGVGGMLSKVADDVDEVSTATDYLVNERGLSEAQATAVLKALKDSGAGSSDGTLKQVAKSIDDSSLQALVKAVDDITERDTARNALAPASVEVTVPRDGYTFTIEGREGDSLQSLVEHGTELADYMECACQGQLMCSTCHVYVDEESLAQMDPPDDYEQDMIDIAYEPRDNSRLGCQLKLRPDSLLKVQIPDSSNNYFN
ncbi:Adrenodoxin, mitochondrial [Hondaea fermentalgiana]|uniref:Adrenodoxin, mitochondrial n=1 Tax=Hondaea fermentalgiana TaxID=2315210 RepID=A0A2R5GPC6_9STRA|nr:Adrenodoxin, mitochondrial [Hondaea fermentalgiana]|eukprot:GBG30473.1 Adrenodoxin, mitochondrial [Hondaea fermentalgiana]